MKIAFDVVPLVAFLAVLLIWDIYTATAVLIAGLWLSVVSWRLIYGAFRRTHVLLALVATALGALTLYLHDATFIKWKPTLVYLAFSGAMGVNLLLGRNPFMKAALHEAFDMPEDWWNRIELAWIAFWIVCGALNLAVAYSFSDQIWGIYKVVGGIGLPILFMVAHWPFVGQFLRHETKVNPEPPR